MKQISRHMIVNVAMLLLIVALQFIDFFGQIRNFRAINCVSALAAMTVIAIEIADMAYIRAEHTSAMSDVTGLSNKKAFEDKIQELKDRESIMDTAAIFFDLNNLKKTNDTYGHDAGDELIGGFSNLLLSVAPKNAFAARIGGDEFVMILEDSSEFQVKSILEQMEKKRDKLNAKRKVPLSYASGSAISKAGAYFLPEELLKLADQRMYEDKREYKKRMNSELTG